MTITISECNHLEEKINNKIDESKLMNWEAKQDMKAKVSNIFTSIRQNTQTRDTLIPKEGD